MIPLLAEASTTSSLSWEILVLGGVQLLTLLSLLPTVIKSLSGRGDERQIEPTQLAAISTQLDNVETAISAMNREVGEVCTLVERSEGALAELARKQETDIVGAHRRIDVIDRDLAETKARVSAIERHCPKC